MGCDPPWFWRGRNNSGGHGFLGMRLLLSLMMLIHRPVLLWGPPCYCCRCLCLVVAVERMMMMSASSYVVVVVVVVTILAPDDWGRAALPLLLLLLLLAFPCAAAAAAGCGSFRALPLPPPPPPSPEMTAILPSPPPPPPLPAPLLGGACLEGVRGEGVLDDPPLGVLGVRGVLDLDLDDAADLGVPGDLLLFLPPFGVPPCCRHHHRRRCRLWAGWTANSAADAAGCGSSRRRGGRCSVSELILSAMAMTVVALALAPAPLLLPVVVARHSAAGD